MQPSQEYPYQPANNPQSDEQQYYQGYPQQQQPSYNQPPSPAQGYPQQQPPYGQPPMTAQGYPQQMPSGMQPPYNQYQSAPQGYPSQPQPFMGQPMQNYYQTPMMAPPYNQMPGQVNVTVNVGQSGPSFLMRAIWYIFIGWWLGAWWLAVGYLCCLSIFLLPVGLIMLNRLPWVLTLKSSSQQTRVDIVGNSVNVSVGGPRQYSFLMRTLYFVFIGWWIGGLWASVGYLLCLSLLFMPVGLIMLNRLPFVLTLRQV